jgi:hypothetical protein
MTWLSRLLPQSPGLPRLANHNNRTRQGQRRRRMATLESLENRTLLTGNVTVSAVVNGVLTISLDKNSNNLQINEDGGNKVIVNGLAGTSVNGTFVPIKRLEVTSIVVNVLQGSAQNSPHISLVEKLDANQTSSGIGKVAVNITGGPITGPDVNLTVTGVNNGGPLTVSDKPGGKLDVQVEHSQFTSMDIEQFGCCQAHVDLQNDRVNGPVKVSEGYYGALTSKDPDNQKDGDVISYKYDTFGSTSFSLGNGPAPTVNPNTCGTCDNAWSRIYGDNSTFKDLTISEPNSGDHQYIGVGTATSDVEVYGFSSGVKATQGDGNDNTISIISITSYGTTNKIPPTLDNIVTVQGKGNEDSVVVDSSHVNGNITSTQGNGAEDFAGYFGNRAGFTETIKGADGSTISEDLGGLAQITQGNGKNDVVWLDCGKYENVDAEQFFNDVIISQGNGSIVTPSCNQQWGDAIIVNWTKVTSDMTLTQGQGDATAGLDLGSNLIIIASSYSWDDYEVVGSPVTVGGATVINEIGHNNGQNTILMGGINGPDTAPPPDFETGTLDVYTGAAGGSFVQVYDTLVDNGAQGLFPDQSSPPDGLFYNITGGTQGGTSLNTAAVDVFSNGTVTLDPDAFVVGIV